MTSHWDIAARGGRYVGIRYFAGPDGERWSVYEAAQTAYDRRRGPSLVFEAGHLARRVRDYPENWRELSDEALCELARRA